MQSRSMHPTSNLRVRRTKHPSKYIPPETKPRVEALQITQTVQIVAYAWHVHVHHLESQSSVLTKSSSVKPSKRAASTWNCGRQAEKTHTRTPKTTKKYTRGYEKRPLHAVAARCCSGLGLVSQNHQITLAERKKVMSACMKMATCTT